MVIDMTGPEDDGFPEDFDDDLEDDCLSDWEYDCGLGDDGQCGHAGSEQCDFGCPMRDSEWFAGSKAWNKKHYGDK